jgi:methylmalonyl-CoA mutase N-terminal domain/subunit
MGDALNDRARRWRAKHAGPDAMRAYRPDIGPKPPRTISGAPLEPLHDPSRQVRPRPAEELFPGLPPYSRGIHPGMYRQRLWTFRQYAGFGSAVETNGRFKRLLDSGQTGLSVAFDLPTQLGMDPDDPRARGEVGRVGVSIASVENMERLFQDIDLSQISTSMTINAPAAVILAFYQATAERQGIDPAQLRGTVQNDMLKEYAARNTYIYPPGPSMDLTVDVMEHCAGTLTGFHPVSVSGYHMREAGCTAPLEVAFTLANGLAYVSAAHERGIPVVRVGRQISFFFSAATEVLEEVAKFRAARRMWARLMNERFGITDPKALQLRFHVQTCGSMLTSRQAENNLARVAFQALAGVLGGCQSLHTNGLDEALGLPTERSAHLALMTQAILAHETGVAATVDPFGGSYTIEAMTDDLEDRATGIMRQIEELGGARAAVEVGFYRKLIADAAYRHQREFERGERKVVGVNACTDNIGPEVKPKAQAIPPDLEKNARKTVADLRSRRNRGKCHAALNAVEDAARANRNRMPAILEAARQLCTVGEICGALLKVYGRHQPRN